MSSTPEHHPARDHRPTGGGEPSVDKARNPLPLTVQGERGLREGELWNVNNQQLWFFTGERLTLNFIYEMRIDTRGSGGNVDLVVKIASVSVGQSAGVKKGYLHTARFRTKRPGETAKLLTAFGKLNPELAAPIAAAPTSPTPTAPARPVGRPTPPLETRQKTDSTPPRPRSGQPEPAPQRALPKAPSKKPRSTEPLRSEPTAAKRSSTSGSAHQVIPQIGPGTPPAVLLHYPDQQTLRTHLRIEQGDLFLYAAPAAQLQERQGVTLHIQLPLGAFITLVGRVSESSGRRCSFIVRRIDAATHNTISAALN
jgi:hypothetical protein